MSNVFTLDSLREEVESEFAPMKLGLSDGTEVVLRSLLRLKAAERTEVLESLKNLKMDDDGDSPERVEHLTQSVSRVLEVIADNGKKFLKELDGDLLLMMKVLNRWMEETQVGEAQTSPDS